MDQLVIVAAHTTGNSTAILLGRSAGRSEKFTAVSGRQALAEISPTSDSNRVAKIQGSLNGTDWVDLVTQTGAGVHISARVALYPHMRLSTTTAGSTGSNRARLIG